MGLLSTLSASFFVGEGLSLVHLAKMVELTLEHGVTPESPYGLAWFGVLIAGLYNRSDDGLAYGLAALNLIDRHGYEAERIATLIAIDQVSAWSQRLAYALAHAQQARKLGRAAGDIGMACYACNHIASDLLAMGEHLALVEEEITVGLELIELVQYRDVELILLAQRRFTRHLRGGDSPAASSEVPATAANADVAGDAAYSAAAAARSHATRFFIWLYDGMASVRDGDYERARERLAFAEALLWAVPAHISTAECELFSALAEARAACADTPEAPTIAKLHARRDRFVQWAQLNPLTFRSKLLLVEASLHG
jgi:predicted ATPase